MNPRKIAILFLALVFPAIALANEPEPEGDQQPSSVTILGETEERSQEVTVRAMTLREILLQRLRERHAAGLDTDIPESFIENLPDEAIEEIFRQADEEEDFDLGVLTWGEGGEKREESSATENPENSSVLDFLRENKWILAATAAGAATFAAVGYGFAKEDDDFDGDDEDEDTETASAGPDDSFFSWGGVAEAGDLHGGGGGNWETGEIIPQTDGSANDVGFMLSDENGIDISNEELVTDIANGFIQTEIEGTFSTVVETSDEEKDHPSIGVTQWEGERANNLLSQIPGGDQYIGRSFPDIERAGDVDALGQILSSPTGQEVQRQMLMNDIYEMYLPEITSIAGLHNKKCMIYVAMWCPTSTYYATSFVEKCRRQGKDINNLAVLSQCYENEYWIYADVGKKLKEGYANRARKTYEYVSQLVPPSY